jgi:uncharacterized protein (TIGR03084 family)
MQATCQDLLDEYQALDAFCAELTPQEWDRPSLFYAWSTWDQIAHLLLLDETALLSATDAQAFAADANILQRRLADGEEISAIARLKYGHLNAHALLKLWRQRYRALVAALAKLDPKARLAWYGPSMSARSFATARLMETWAHGQDCWDLMERRRPASGRLRHIAHIGVTTYAWTFVNRRLPVPQPQPYVALQSPDGSLWSWGDQASSNRVVGTAEDFCLVVTQRRHVRDTPLLVDGEGAGQWMSLTQCFAGPPHDPPAPGLRKLVHADA